MDVVKLSVLCARKAIRLELKWDLPFEKGGLPSSIREFVRKCGHVTAGVVDLERLHGKIEARCVFGKDLFNGPGAIAVNSKNQWVVSDCSAHKVYVFSPMGKKISEFGPDFHYDDVKRKKITLNLPHGLGVDPDDRILIADTGSHRVVVLAPDGKLVLVINGTDIPHKIWPEQKFGYPCGITSDAMGRIIVADQPTSSCHVFDRNGKHELTICSRQPLQGPHGVCVDMDGNIGLCSKTNNSVVFFDQREAEHLYSVKKDFKTLIGASFDGSGHLFISEWSTGRVQVFKGTKHVLTIHPSQLGKNVLGNARDVAINKSGWIGIISWEYKSIVVV